MGPNYELMWRRSQTGHFLKSTIQGKYEEWHFRQLHTVQGSSHSVNSGHPCTTPHPMINTPNEHVHGSVWGSPTRGVFALIKKTTLDCKGPGILYPALTSVERSPLLQWRIGLPLGALSERKWASLVCPAKSQWHVWSWTIGSNSVGSAGVFILCK
jgi:hypothetical protein